MNRGGERIGVHSGALIYTLGQRHGFTLSTSTANEIPHYVIAKNINDNTITVDTKPTILPKATGVKLKDINIIQPFQANELISVQFRYRQTPIPATVILNDDEIVLTTNDNTEKPASGQSCVLYRGAEGLGGGIIA